MISDAPSLNNFDRNKEIVIQTDSSKNGIGCVLLQDKKPISFASKSLSHNEIKYAQIEKEFLAILFACQRFHYFIYGQKIKIQTDHKPLIGIMNKEIHQIPSSRLQRIHFKLSMCDFELVYTPGKNMLIADAISRACSTAENIETDIELNQVIHTVNVSDKIIEKIKYETNKDEILQELISLCINGWPQDKCKILL